MEKNIKISINLPEGLYREIENSALDNERTIAGEVVYRVRRYNQGSINLQGGVISGLGTMPSAKKEETKVDEGWLYEEVIAKIGGSMDREVDFEERSQINKMVKDAGLVWNAYKKRLERPLEGGEFKLIHQF